MKKHNKPRITSSPERRKALEIIRQPLNQTTINELLRYDEQTGLLFARLPFGAAKAGDKVGTLRPDGRRQISIRRRLYLEHRIIWFMKTGEWPRHQIDHKDLVRSNNTPDNIRECDNSQNNANRRVRPDNECGIKGVKFEKRRGHWVSHITKNRKLIYLGSFETPEAAGAAYSSAARKLHGDFARNE